MILFGFFHEFLNIKNLILSATQYSSMFFAVIIAQIIFNIPGWIILKLQQNRLTASKLIFIVYLLFSGIFLKISYFFLNFFL